MVTALAQAHIMSIVIGPRAGKYEVLLWVAGQARGAEPAREREPVEPGKQVSGVTSEAVDEAVVHILRQHEAIVLVPSSGAGAGTPRHRLDEADASRFARMPTPVLTTR